MFIQIFQHIPITSLSLKTVKVDKKFILQSFLFKLCLGNVYDISLVYKTVVSFTSLDISFVARKQITFTGSRFCKKTELSLFTIQYKLMLWMG